MVDLCDQKAREVGGDPLLVELVLFFLLNAVVARDVKALAVVGLEIGIGRFGAQAFEIGIEMVLGNREREVGIRMSVESFRYQDIRAQKHRASSEFREQLALNFQVP